MYKYSIIIPHKNIPELLQRCLDSIPKKEDIQVIVVDDNSSSEIVDFECFPGMNRNNTICVFDKSGGGAGRARNIGLAKATGKWVLFADADDFFVKDFDCIIDKFYESDAQIILFKANSVNSDTMKIANRHQDLNDTIDKAIHGNILPAEAALGKPVPWCKMIRRKFIIDNDIVFQEVMASNDMMFVAKVTVNANKIIPVDNVLYVVTERSGSLMANYKIDPENHLCRIKVMIDWNRFLKDYNQFRHFRQPIIVYVWRARKFGFKYLCKSFLLAIRNKALFSGFSHLMRTVKRHLRITK